MIDNLDNAPCGYVVFDDEGELLAVNRTLADALGYAPDELVGKKFESLLSVGARIFYHTHFFPILKLHGKAEEIYLTIRSRGGADIPMLVNGIRRERGGAMFNECVLVRMLQRDQYEDELLRAKRTAEAANQAKVKFLSMMSHELRTPLQAISGYCQLLLEGSSGPVTSEQRADLNTIENASEDVVRMLNDILEFARLEQQSGKLYLMTAPADAVVTRAEALMRPKFAEAGLRYERVGCDRTRWLRADVDRLQQVLLNVLTNAIKFTPRGGTVNVECSGDEAHTRIGVRDTGCGIAQEYLDRIFEPFVQIDAPRGQSFHRGVGLGLAISRDLLRSMGGELTVQSELGTGSIFTISLPAAKAEAPQQKVSRFS